MSALILLPGMDGTGDLFAPFIAALPAEAAARVVSYPSDGALGYAALTDIARRALPADGPYLLLGESFSGPIAVTLAAETPRGLRGVVVCCSFVRTPHRFLRLLRPLASRVPIHAVPRTLLARVVLGAKPPRDVAALFSDAIAKVSPGALRARIAALADLDVTSALARVRVPVLCLRATEDRVVPRSCADAIATACSRARIEDVAGPHLLLQTQPAEAAARVARFLRDVADAT